MCLGNFSKCCLKTELLCGITSSVRYRSGAMLTHQREQTINKNVNSNVNSLHPESFRERYQF